MERAKLDEEANSPLAIRIDMPSLDPFLDRQLRMLNLPGMAVAVLQDGRIAYLRGLGVAGPGRSMTPQTPLILGSIFKSLTALAVMQLVETGKIDLDTLVLIVVVFLWYNYLCE